MAPEAFEKCLKSGGKVRTVTGKKFGLKEGQYKHICIKGGKSYLGHTKTKKK